MPGKVLRPLYFHWNSGIRSKKFKISNYCFKSRKNKKKTNLSRKFSFSSSIEAPTPLFPLERENFSERKEDIILKIQQEKPLNDLFFIIYKVLQ